MAAMISGILSYRVVSGTAVVHRGVDAAGAPSSIEELTGPAETELNPGDTVVEDSSMLHFGANRTTEDVVILATLITEARQDLAVPVPTTTVE
jgi:hypothetical protein